MGSVNFSYFIGEILLDDCDIHNSLRGVRALKIVSMVKTSMNKKLEIWVKTHCIKPVRPWANCIAR